MSGPVLKATAPSNSAWLRPSSWLGTQADAAAIDGTTERLVRNRAFDCGYSVRVSRQKDFFYFTASVLMRARPRTHDRQPTFVNTPAS